MEAGERKFHLHEKKKFVFSEKASKRRSRERPYKRKGWVKITKQKTNEENIYIYIYWRSRDELIRDVLLWIPTHGRAKAGRPARTYIQQLCEDTGCCPEDLPRAMNDREEWRERVRDIRATCAI